jgi:hypothetical protein
MTGFFFMEKGLKQGKMHEKPEHLHKNKKICEKIFAKGVDTS